MKVFGILLALAVAQAAVVPRRTDGLVDRSVLYPRAPVPQTSSYFEPIPQPITKAGPTVCGKAADAKIVGGDEVAPNSVPWQVALNIDAKYFCGGSLISEDWVLTAAHCMDGAKEVVVTLGAHNKNENEATQVKRTSTNFTIHPQWGSTLIRNDLALIKLSPPAPINDKIQPVCLAPSDEPDHAGDTMTVTGWGKTSDSPLGSTSPVLRTADVVGINNTVCAESYNVITDNIMCVSTKEGKGSCNGDSGGPLTHTKNGRKDQVGIVSFGSSSGCAVGIPSAYTKVSSYVTWIQSITGVQFF